MPSSIPVTCSMAKGMGISGSTNEYISSVFMPFSNLTALISIILLERGELPVVTVEKITTGSVIFVFPALKTMFFTSSTR